MSRPFRWTLAVIAILILIFSLCAIFINGKPLFDSSNRISWVGFAIAFCILMVLLCYLNIKVGIAYTIIILLFLLVAWSQFRHTNEKNQNEIASETEQQLDENGNLILDHPYDDLISLQWGTYNTVDMDLMLIKQSDDNVINYNSPEHIIDNLNSVWLDYDYKMQQDVAMKEIVSILGMREETFSVIVMKYNEEELKSDAVLMISLSNGNTKKYTLSAERFNDETNGVHVCDLVMQTEDIIGVMKDLDSNEIKTY